MDSRIESVLDEAFPGKEVADVKASGPSWNDKNETVGVEFADGQTIFLKTAADGSGTRVAREQAVIDYVGANTEVPVPTVVARDPDAEIPYLATAPVDGPNLIESWSDADEERRAELARQVGRTLAEVHSLRFEDHGQVVGGGADGLELDAGSWTDVLVDRVEYLRELSSSERFDHHFDEVVAAVEENRDLLDDAPAVLVHGDPAQPNCFCTDEQIGLLDWEIAHVGDPARELVRARSQQFDGLRERGPDSLVQAFHEGYRERAGGLPDGFEDRQPIYEAVRFLGTSGYFDKWLNLVDEEPEELADWISEEMERRLAEIA